MLTTDFTSDMIPAAKRLAAAEYSRERERAPFLPELRDIPGLDYFAGNGFGAAAVEGGELAGFIGFCNPWDGAFGTDARGTFSPAHAHAASAFSDAGRAGVYGKMYTYAAGKFAKLGVAYHALSLWAHDAQALETFFMLGFGCRCADAAMKLDPDMRAPRAPEGFIFAKLAQSGLPSIRKLRRALSDHLGESPCFLTTSDGEYDEWLARAETRGTAIYVASRGGEPKAFIEIGEDGESAVSESPEMKNVCGAYCEPELRGTGLFPALVYYAAAECAKTGAKVLGVDYETINPAAKSSWERIFTPYTRSVARRIL